MGGIAEIAAAIRAPGVIRQVSDYTRIRFGEMDGSDSPRGRALDDAFRAAGIESEFTRTINSCSTILCGRKLINSSGLSPVSEASSLTSCSVV